LKMAMTILRGTMIVLCPMHQQHPYRGPGWC
jgi:hypothetical protein